MRRIRSSFSWGFMPASGARPAGGPSDPLPGARAISRRRCSPYGEAGGSVLRQSAPGRKSSSRRWGPDGDLLFFPVMEAGADHGVPDAGLPPHLGTRSGRLSRTERFREETDVLERGARPPATRSRWGRRPATFAPLQQHLAGRRHVDAGDQVEDRRLPRAPFWPDEADQVARLQGEPKHRRQPSGPPKKLGTVYRAEEETLVVSSPGRGAAFPAAAAVPLTEISFPPEQPPGAGVSISTMSSRA